MKTLTQSKKQTVQNRKLGSAAAVISEGHVCGGEHNHDDIAFSEPKVVCKLFENEAFQEICGETLHPGGIELTEKALSLSHFPKGAKLLDIGCGKGETVNLLKSKYGYDAIGLEQSEVLLEEAKKAFPDSDFKRGDADFLDFPSRIFDGVFMECVLSLCDKKEEVLHEIWCVLKNGGKLVLSDLYLREPEKAQSGDAGVPVQTCLTGAFRSEELKAQLKATGFTGIQWFDCSEGIRSFTAAAIMKYGSLDKFWEEVLPAGSNTNEFAASIMSGKPGYFLLLAEKPL